MKSAPYWWEDAPLAALPAIELPTRADTVIIGAGYTGLSAALTLLRAGRSVIVIEAALAAEGASSRNGGMCGDLLKPSFTQLSARYGKQRAVALYSDVRDALVFLQEVIADNKIECDFARHNMPFRDKKFDLATCIEVIEHLEKPAGQHLIGELERVASHVIITTPGIYFDQGAFDQNPWQRHVSKWDVDDFEKRGYKVQGLGNARILARFPLLTVPISPLLLKFPRLSTSLICTRNLA